MFPYKELQSSWVAGVGYNSITQTLYVGTKGGQCYKVLNVPAEELSEIESLANTGKSVGSFISSHIFKAYSNVEVTLLEAVEETGADPSVLAGSHQPQVGKKQKVRDFLDYLLPSARTGLFSFC